MTFPFNVGQTHSMLASVTEADLDAFVSISGDAAPLHVDVEYARAAGYEGRLVHGALLVARVSKLIGMEFPGPIAILERLDVSFRNPCYAPCDLMLSARVRQVSEAVASIILDIEVADNTGRMLATCKTWHRILVDSHD